MKTTVEFLNAVKARYDIPTDGRLAVKVGLTRSAISRFMSGKDHLGDETAMRVADLLDLDPAYVVACVHVERAKRQEEKALWERMATMASGIAAVVLVAAGLPFLPLPAGDVSIITNSAENGWGAVYYVKSIGTVLPILGLLLALYLALPHNRPPKE